MTIGYVSRSTFKQLLGSIPLSRGFRTLNPQLCRSMSGRELVAQYYDDDLLLLHLKYVLVCNNDDDDAAADVVVVVGLKIGGNTAYY